MASETIALAAYLVREACGLDDRETVQLFAGAEPVRKMALRARDEFDSMRKEARTLSEALNLFAENPGFICPGCCCSLGAEDHDEDCDIFDAIRLAKARLGK